MPLEGRIASMGSVVLKSCLLMIYYLFNACLLDCDIVTFIFNMNPCIPMRNVTVWDKLITSTHANTKQNVKSTSSQIE